MLNRSHRLSTKDFMEVMNKGRVGHSSLFLIRTLTTTEGVGIAVVAPKKVASTAVGRNRIRRQVYTAIYPLISNIKPGTHSIVFAKNEALKASVKDMTVDLKAYFVKK